MKYFYPLTHYEWLASNFSLQHHPSSHINVTRIKEWTEGQLIVE